MTINIHPQKANEKQYRKIKEQLEKQYSNKYVVIVNGGLLGAEDSLEKAWALASPYENALVTRIAKKPMRAKLLGSSLRLHLHKMD
ncbi:Uncharacterised protein [uncultured archaeon]|nr:Uncharacterised protein [uncultured archaeon]